VNFNLSYQPPDTRDSAANPWPQWPKVFTVEYGHGEAAHKLGKEPRQYNIQTKEFLLDEKTKCVTGIKTNTVVWKQRPGTVGRAGMDMIEKANSTHVFPADLVLIAIGYSGVENSFGVKIENGKYDTATYATSTRGIFAAGDCRRGQSLIVWAIREGREAADQIHSYLQQ